MLALDEFPIEYVTKLLILGTLLSTGGGGSPDEEPEWEPEWYEKLAIGASNIWDWYDNTVNKPIYNIFGTDDILGQAADGGKNLLNLMAISQYITNQSQSTLGRSRREITRPLNWYWDNPDELASHLTDNTKGQTYIEDIVLPRIRSSPTGRAVINELLDHAPANVYFLPDFLPEEVVELIGANIQPFGDTIFMYDDNQAALVFVHEGVHMLQRETGVDPKTFAGRILPVPYQPGFSLQMEREAHAVELTIRFELEQSLPDPNDDILMDLSNQIRNLTMEGDEVAFQQVLDYDIYDSFPEGNVPPRDWREDLRQMGLGNIIPSIESAAQFPAQPPPPPPPSGHHIPE